MKKLLHFKYSTSIILLTIFIFALVLRIVLLSEFPVGFQTDEAIIGDTGYSLLKTARDTNGVFLPLYTEVFGDYIPTGYHVMTVPSIMMFGLSEFATRLPGALFGALTVFPVYYLARVFFKRKRIALLSALFFAAAPWSLILSRGSSEASIAVFFVLGGFAFYLDSFQKMSVRRLIAGAMMLSMSFFIYHTPRLFVPLMLASLFVYFFPQIKALKNKGYRNMLVLVSIIVVLIVGILIISFNGATARFNQVSIFSYPETRLVMEEQIREDGSMQSPILTRVFHNKIINNSFAFIGNYSEYLSINTLFLRPGVPKLFEIPNVGLIYILFIPFFFYGAARIIMHKDKTMKTVFIWVLVAPITAALTVDDVPNMRRASILFPIIEMISIFGLVSFIQLFRGKLKMGIIFVLALGFIWNFLYFEHQYFVHAKTHRTLFRNNGFAEMMHVVNDNYDKYDKVVMAKSSGGYPLVLFYSKYNPSQYQREGSPKDVDYKGFGKYIFVPNDCPSINPSVDFPKGTKVLYVDIGTCTAPGKFDKKYQDIRRQDGSMGFRVVY